MRSLMDILNDESEVVRKIKSYDVSIHIDEDTLECIRSIDIDCKCKEDDLNYYECQIEEVEGYKREAESRLAEIRIELRDYLKSLFN